MTLDAQLHAPDDEPFEAPEPVYKHPVKVGKQLRQPKPKTSVVTGELPWWAKAERNGMMKAAAGEMDRMNASRESRQVDGIRKANFTW